MISQARKNVVRTPETGSLWPVRQPAERPALPVRFPNGLPVAAGVPANPGIRPAREDQPSFSVDLARQMIELRGYALWLCRSSSLADDLIQETLLNAWAARSRFEAGTNLKAWCTTILRNVFFSHKRRSWRTTPLSDDIIANLASEECNLDHRLELLSLRHAIGLLPLDQREAILLVGVGSKSYIEAAKVCGCAVGTIKSRVSRARVRLAELMLGSEQSLISNSTLSVGDAIDDLMDQLALLAGGTDQAGDTTARLMHRQPVQSEPV